MRTRIAHLTALAILLGGMATTGWSQVARVTGVVIRGGQPLPGVTVVYVDTDTNHQYKTKTDKKGEYIAVGIPYGFHYRIDVFDPNGTKLFEKTVAVTGNEDADHAVIDLAKTTETVPTASKEEIAKHNAEQERVKGINAFIAQYQEAMKTKDYKAAEPPLKQMVATDPSHYEYFQALGEVQYNLAQYQDAVDTYEKGIQSAQAVASASGGTAPKGADPAKAKAVMAQMLSSEGNAYLKLNKPDQAVEKFTKAAEMDPNPGTAYFNLCATAYNTGKMKEASVACDKAIAADPNRADAYFIKGSAMFAEGKLDANNKYVPPDGTDTTLKKYLELSPDGPHANDVKALLQSMGSTIETTYKSRPAKKK